MPPGQIPNPQENNLWYSFTNSNTVLIFLHGIFSDSRGCWLYQRPGKRGAAAKTVYWPELVSNDSNFAGVDVFLAGFYTDIQARDYDLRQCALEVYQSLNIPRAPATEPVMAKKNLIFLGHSTGGIVARYILERNQIAFREKNIGVVLIASPSAGSIYANWFDFLSQIYKNELGGLLTEGNTILEDLDSRFREMVYKKAEHIPNLIGREACENHLVLRRKVLGRFSRWFPPWVTRRVVDPNSAWRYFGQGRMLPGTDHFSAVKPDSADHPAHQFLLSFWTEFQQEFLRRDAAARAAPRAQSRSPILVILVPPRSAGPIVGRDQTIAGLKKRLLAGGSHALCGGAGTGKTTIALQIAHDPDLRAAYPDGVLWGDLSAERSASAELASWAEALNVDPNTVAALKRPQDRAVAVARAIAERRMLLIVDDCDRAADAMLFQLPGPNCAHLLTTRSMETAKTFAAENIVPIDYLSDEEALQIVEQFAPPLAGHRDATMPFVKALGGKPAQILMFARMLGSAPSEAGKLLELLTGAAKESL